MSGSGTTKPRFCVVRRYTSAWEMGTGLLVSLAPGKYRITGEERLDGVHYLLLEETYRLDARKAAP